MLKRFLVICLFGAFCIPVAAWAFYKPTRVLAPELNGVSCVSDVICMDDVSRYEEAAELYDEAYGFVIASVGAIEKKPRVIFCASEACFQSFGFNKAAAHTVGVSGIVMAPRGWKNYYLRHEMIHHLEADMLARGLEELQPPVNSLLFIENVGNLVCPALFDLGEYAKVVMLSVTEGEDKPLKYPHMFKQASVMLLNKIDLLPHLTFNVSTCLEYACMVNPAIQVFQISAMTGEGLQNWYDWVSTRINSSPHHGVC